MIREAEPKDLSALEAFLLSHIDVAMFPMANLRGYGIGAGGFASEHPNASRFWMIGPELDGVVAVSQRGMIMAVVPKGGDIRGLGAALEGVVISGAVGEGVATRRVLAAVGLDKVTMRRDADEPGFGVSLAKLQVPDATGAQVLKPDCDQRDMLIGWRTDYHLEIMGTPSGLAAATAARDIDGYIAAGSHRVLLQDGVAVAMTGFNAALPEIVQIGGVYVPPDLRGRGYARLAVALHLLEAQAVLFAANEAAARAYRGIGFQRTGTMALVLFDVPHRVRA